MISCYGEAFEAMSARIGSLRKKSRELSAGFILSTILGPLHGARKINDR